MRVGAVVLLYNGFCYQSYNWKVKRPLGELQGVIDSLEEYECDEIAIIRPVRDDDSFEVFKKDIEIIKSLKSMTPLSFGGGVRTMEHLKLLHKLPIERLIFTSSFLNKDEKLIKYAQNLYGRQAIQCLLPMGKDGVFNPQNNSYISLKDFDFIDNYANEVILFDTENEGVEDSFNSEILKSITIKNNKLILSGGIGKKTIKSAKKSGIASVLIENRVLYTEYSLKGYKNV